MLRINFADFDNISYFTSSYKLCTMFRGWEIPKQELYWSFAGWSDTWLKVIKITFKTFSVGQTNTHFMEIGSFVSKIKYKDVQKAVPWLRRLVAGLSPRRPGVRSQVKSMWDLWWTKWHKDRFFSELSVFPCRFHSTGAPLIVKIGKKKLLILIMFIGVAQKALRLWCEGPSFKKKRRTERNNLPTVRPFYSLHAY
jgi:hypothetical protein